MAGNFDLLGDPIPENHGKAGANGHIPTAENVKKVRLLLVAGMEVSRIAEQLGISMPTLRKHYFSSGVKRDVRAARRRAIADEKAKALLRLDKAAEKGNVTAIKEMNAILQAERIKDLSRDAAGDDEQPAEKPEAPAPRNKKDQRVDAAVAAIDGDDLLNPVKVH